MIDGSKEILRICNLLDAKSKAAVLRRARRLLASQKNEADKRRSVQLKKITR